MSSPTERNNVRRNTIIVHTPIVVEKDIIQCNFIVIPLFISTLVSITIIILDALLINNIITFSYYATIAKTVASALSSLIFSFSSILYVFRYNLKYSDPIDYYRKFDLRSKGLEILGYLETYDINADTRNEIRDTIMFRAGLKDFSFMIGILFIYFNILTIGIIYTKEHVLSKTELLALNMFLSVFSPILSIIFSYITILCDNIVILESYLSHRAFDKIKVILRNPLLLIFSCNDDAFLND